MGFRHKVKIISWLHNCCAYAPHLAAEVMLFVPSVVNVSEGQVAVVCFQADFGIFGEEDIDIQLNLTLAVVDVETSKLCTYPSPISVTQWSL